MAETDPSPLAGCPWCRTPGEWHPIEEAPRDGTMLTVLYDDGSEEPDVYWSDERYCMLGSPQGSCGPGWVSTGSGNLLVEDITHWWVTRPQPTAAHGLADDVVEQVARLFHQTYEKLAPYYGYETRPETREFDPNTANGRLMLHTVQNVLEQVALPDTRESFAAGIEAAAKRLEDSAAMFINADCAQAQVLRAEAVCVRRLAHRAAKETTDG